MKLIMIKKLEKLNLILIQKKRKIIILAIYIQTFLNNLKIKRITNIKIGFNPRSIIKKNKLPNEYNYKQKISTNNKNNNDEINFGEKKIIIDIWNNSIEKVLKDKPKSKKNNNNKDYLFEIESLMAEKVINREIELSINETNILIKVKKSIIIIMMKI